MVFKARSMAVCAMVLLHLSVMLFTGCGAKVYESYASPEELPERESELKAESMVNGPGLSVTNGAQSDNSGAESCGDNGGLTGTESYGDSDWLAGTVSSGSADPPTIFVHVCGAVQKSGVYELPEGSRVYEAIEAAGGVTGEADEAAFNQAAELSDGQQIYVLTKEEVLLYGKQLNSGEGLSAGSGTQPFAEGTSAEGSGGEKGKININTADASALMTLKGIGASRAADIISYRENYGPFESIEDIMKVSGIKGAVFQKIQDEITVG